MSPSFAPDFSSLFSSTSHVLIPRYHPPVMAGFDTASLRLALELQLQDVEGLKLKPKGRGRKRKAGDADFEFALGAYQEDLTAEIQSVGGRFPAPPPAPIASSSRPKKRLATGKRNGPSPKKRVNPRRAAKASSPHAAVSTQSAAAQTGQEAASNALQCRVCFEDQDEESVFRTPCDHVYCAACLVGHVTSALTGGCKFPPECCSTPIPFEGAALQMLPADLVARFQRMQLELSTPNPRYCHDPACAAFLPPSDFAGDRGLCSSCRAWTCILCRAAAHDGVCPSDAAQNEVRDMARRRGWRPCVRCGNLVERTGGCAHMSESQELAFLVLDQLQLTRLSVCPPPCNGQFCYHCGLAWRTCGCSNH